MAVAQLNVMTVKQFAPDDFGARGGAGEERFERAALFSPAHKSTAG